MMPYLTKKDRAKRIGIIKGMGISYNLLMKKIDKKLNSKKLLYNPTTLQIEPTTKCNLRCKFCESPVWSRKGMDMSFSDFKKIINQFPYLVDVLLQGIGEPLMCRDLFKMIEYCKKKKIMVAITTNGTLLDKKIARKLVDSGIDWVFISMDGANAETFEKSKIDAKFDDVIKNTKALVAARGKKNHPVIRFHFTGTKNNIHELPDVVRLAKEIGIEEVEAQDVHFWGDTKLMKKNKGDEMKHEIDKCRKIIDETKSVSEDIGIDFHFMGTGEKSANYSNLSSQLHADQRSCQKIFKSCFITVDGYVTTCACAPDPRKHNFGNLLKKNFKDIWNGTEYVKARVERMKGNIPDFCKTCTVPHPIR